MLFVHKACMSTQLYNIENVCIIDDDKIHHFAMLKTMQLQGLSKNLVFFHNGGEALTFLNQNLDNAAVLPDVIFLDLNMPVVNGWQFLQQFALVKPQIKKEIKIYVVSSSINQSEISRAISIEEVSGYIEKPLRPEAIRRVFTHNIN